MIRAVLKSEILKLRHSPIWIAFFAMPLIPAVFGTVNYLNNLEELRSGWYSLWTQHTLFSGYFFLPLMIGVYCAYLWRLEHSGYNWNQTLTLPVSRTALVLAKLVLALAMSAAMLIWTFLLFILSGLFFCDLGGALPRELAEWFFCGLAGAAAICAVQLFLGLIFRSFAVPVGLSLMGGIWGLMMLAKGWWYICPYSLLSMGMNANGKNAVEDYAAFFIACAAFTAVFTALCSLYMRRRGGRTG